MNQQVNRQASPATDRANPVVLPDVATAPHPTPHPNEALPPDEGEGATVLEDAFRRSPKRPAKWAASNGCPKSRPNSTAPALENKFLPVPSVRA
jgi:hypothetical protein